MIRKTGMTAIGLLLLLPGTTFASQPAVVLQRVLGNTSVTVHRHQSVQTSDTATIVWEPGSVGVVMLPDFIEGYLDAHIWAGTKLVITGESWNGGTRVLVIDRQSSAVVDSFYARSPSISSTGRFIAFTRHYPRVKDEPSEVYLLYDLAQSPDENRMSPSNTEADKRWNAGEAIFPDWNRAEQTLSSAPNSQQTHVLRSPLTWYGDSWLFFVDSYQGHSFAVVINLTNSTSRSAELAASELISVADLPAGFDSASLIYAERIDPLEVSSTQIRARLTLKGNAKVRSLDVTW